MKLSQFSYHLPEDRIAQKPVEPRDYSRLLVLNRNTSEMQHKHYYDLPELLTENDVLVRNNTKVIPARIYGKKTSGGLVELLLVKAVKSETDSETWEVLSKPGIKAGQVIEFGEGKLIAECVGGEGYTRQVKFSQSRIELMKTLDEIGKIPIPPYIQWNDQDEEKLREVYQTTYAKHKGSVAAPTAGLHFTKELDQRLIDKGVMIEEVTLHVGLGTFLPVKTDEVTEHHMHHEVYELNPETAERLNRYKKAGKRIIAVGTTTVRVLETLVNESGKLKAGTGETNIFIYSPYQFKFVQGLITNFHLPESTLLMLVSAFVTQPNTQQEFSTFLETVVGRAYTEAIQEKYRFFSFGDGMLIF